MSVVRAPFVPAFLGSSLTTGRLSADWVPRLNAELPQLPEAVGPIRTLNLGKGSQTSVWGLSQAPLLVALQPSHILFEGFAINDCIDGGSGPAVSRADHIQNIKDMVAAFQAGIPGVDLTLQTMSTISASITGTRPNYADFVADEVATAALLGVRCLDNHAAWPQPLDPLLTNGRILFAASIPAGFTGLDVAGTWDPAAKNGNVTLSSGNLVMTSSVANCSVRGSVGKAAGKWYFEVAASTVVGGVTSIGIATAAASLANGGYLGIDAAGWGYTSTGSIFHAAGSTGGLAAYASGAVIGVALDLTNNKVWWSKNGAWQNGDPATNTGGEAIAAGTWYPAVSVGVAGVCAGQFDNMPGDGLHPIGPGAVDVYLYPNVKAWARARMTEHWDL